MNIFRTLHRIVLPVILSGILLGLKPVLSPAAPTALLTVNTLLDNDTEGDFLCTLREAITAAENNADYHECSATGYGSDTITFSVSGIIPLSSSLPAISDNLGLTIDGTGQNVTISGEDAVRVFYVSDVGASLTLKNLSVIKGDAKETDLGGHGGGVYSIGALTVEACNFSSNNAEWNGGAIYCNFTGDFFITDSTFSSNGAIHSGGAIWANALEVTSSTFISNTANYGGAIIHSSQTVTVTNSTFSGNFATNAGGCIYNTSGWLVEVINSTFSGNSAAGGGCIQNASGAIYLKNTIVANSVAGGNCSGAISNDGNNIEDGTTCGWGTDSGSKSNTPPQLGALGDYGGPTRTFELLAGSPAIDGVTWNAPNGCPGTDQRGIIRPFDGDGDGAPYCDIGAYERKIETYLPLVLKN